jgi:hypothetical protein
MRTLSLDLSLQIFSIYRGDHVYPFDVQETVPAGTNSSLSVVVSHSSTANETYVKVTLSLPPSLHSTRHSRPC